MFQALNPMGILTSVRLACTLNFINLLRVDKVLCLNLTEYGYEKIVFRCFLCAWSQRICL